MKFDFNAPPMDNIAYLAQKHPHITFNYDELMHEAHLRAFSIAKVMDIDLLSDIQKSLIKAEMKGKSYQNWVKELKITLQKYGWLGETEVINPKSGEAKQIYVGAKRLKNIYYTNIRSAYGESRARAQNKLNGEIYYRYVALLDGATRETHANMHGTILPREHPFWKKNYPPNGWGCRCRVMALSKESMETRGLSVSENSPRDIASKDWSYDTRNFTNALQNTIKKRIEKYIDNLPIKEALNNILNDFKEDNKRFKEVNELYQKSISDDIYDKEIVVLTKAPQRLKDSLKTDADKILLSGWTIRSHSLPNSHPEITAFDYTMVHYGLQNIIREKISDNKDNHIVYFMRAGFYYRAVLKRAINKKSKDEIYLSSLIRSSKEIKK